MRTTWLLAAAFCVGCGGAIDTGLLDGGGGGGGDGGGGGKDGGGGGGDAADKCAQLLAQAEQARLAAIECCPTCNVQQCSQQVDGLCCKVTVTNPDSTAVKTYLDALKAVQDAKCQVPCPAIACPVDPTNVCQQNGSCAQM